MGVWRVWKSRRTRARVDGVLRLGIMPESSGGEKRALRRPGSAGGGILGHVFHDAKLSCRNVKRENVAAPHFFSIQET